MMSTETTIEIASYRLPLVVERVNGFYQATSPALDGFLVLAGSLEEVLALAPGVARALLEAMQAGDRSLCTRPDYDSVIGEVILE